MASCQYRTCDSSNIFLPRIFVNLIEHTVEAAEIYSYEERMNPNSPPKYFHIQQLETLKDNLVFGDLVVQEKEKIQSELSWFMLPDVAFCGDLVAKEKEEKSDVLPFCHQILPFVEIWWRKKK